MAAVSLTKQVHRLMKTVGRRTDGQASVVGFEPDPECPDFGLLQVAIEPNAGSYKGGRFTFSIQIPSQFPHTDDTPAVWCESEVYHPNIDTTRLRYCSFATNVCLNMLDIGVYQNSFGLEAIVQGLLFLMHNPNFEDPLTFLSGGHPWEIENVGRYMAGEEIFGGQVFALERAEKYKDKKDGGVPGIADTTDAMEKKDDESPKLIVNTDNKEKIDGDIATNADAKDKLLHESSKLSVNTDNKEKIDGDIATNADAKEKKDDESSKLSVNTDNKEKIDGDIATNADAKEKKDDESLKLIVNTDNKDDTNVATGDESVENGLDNQTDTDDVTNANQVNTDEAAPKGAASSESTLVSEDAGEPTTVNTEHESTAKEADNDNEDENDDEDDVYTGGYKLMELDGELVMVPAEDTDLLDELTTAQTTEDNTDNHANDIAEKVESATDAKEVTDVTPATPTEAQEHQETNNAQPKDTTDVANDAEGGNEATSFVQEEIKPPRLDLSVSNFEKVFRKILTNVKYRGGRVMVCLKRR